VVQNKAPQGTILLLQVPEVGSRLVRIGLVKVTGQDLDIQYGLFECLGYWVIFYLSSYFIITGRLTGKALEPPPPSDHNSTLNIWAGAVVVIPRMKKKETAGQRLFLGGVEKMGPKWDLVSLLDSGLLSVIVIHRSTAPIVTGRPG
jgi:hypothetical protein